jgi:hypothetical protein
LDRALLNPGKPRLHFAELRTCDAQSGHKLLLGIFTFSLSPLFLYETYTADHQ